MRWFKHLTGSQDDEVMAELIDVYGAEGYGVWWIILEKIGGQMDVGTEKVQVRYPVRRWSLACNVDMARFMDIVQFLADRGRFELTEEGGLLTIKCDNLLKYRDEYSKKKSGQTPDKLRTNSGQTPDKLRSNSRQTPRRSDTDTDTDTDTDKKDVRPETDTSDQAKDKNGYSEDFEKWWAEIYSPRKVKKPRAWTAWKKVSKQGLLPEVDFLITAYRQLFKANRTDWTKEGGKYHPHPSTMLNEHYWHDAENVKNTGGSHVGLDEKEYDAGDDRATFMDQLTG